MPLGVFHWPATWVYYLDRYTRYGGRMLRSRYLLCLPCLLLAGCTAPQTMIDPAESTVLHTRNEVRPITRTRTTRTIVVAPAPVADMAVKFENGGNR